MKADQFQENQSGPSTHRGPAERGTVITVHGRPFSFHALSRCGEMHVDLADVVEVLREPERSYPSGGTSGSPRRVAAGNGLAVVVAEQNGAVITVLWDRQTHR